VAIINNKTKIGEIQMSYEQQIMEALARGYCVEPNTSKVLDSDLIMAMTK